MKVQEIANTYGVDRDYFLSWLEGSGYQFKRKMMDIDNHKSDEQYLVQRIPVVRQLQHEEEILQVLPSTLNLLHRIGE
jgi:hypothetical protein